MTIYKWVKFYLKAIWELISLWTFLTSQNLIRQSHFLYIISVNDLLIGLRLTIFSTSSPEKEYLIQFQMNRYHLLSSLSNPSLSIVIGRNSGWESCRSPLYSLCTCGTVEHIKMMHSQGTQRILGTIYAFMGVGFVLIINLFSLVIDSHKAYLLLSWDE